MLRASVVVWVVSVSSNRSPQVCPFVTALLGDGRGSDSVGRYAVAGVIGVVEVVSDVSLP